MPQRGMDVLKAITAFYLKNGPTSSEIRSKAVYPYLCAAFFSHLFAAFLCKLLSRLHAGIHSALHQRCPAQAG